MTTQHDAARTRPQTARRKRPSKAVAGAKSPSKAITPRAPLKPLDRLPRLDPDPFEVELHAQFDVDVRLIDWQASRMSANDRYPTVKIGKRQIQPDKVKRTQLWVELGAAAVRRAAVEPLPWARIVVYTRFPTNVRREVSNLQPTAKGIIDGFVKAGLLPDDRDEMLDGPDMRRLWPNGPHRVVVQVWRKSC
ncbi:RusA-like resolvase [Arthrobacter phage Abba]|uniref:RusA-like resolvase n=1 Tax=Arthrobacter phage Abba TaxID=2713256 RepID=A0A6G8R2H8_9CAUD|nr:RusA-like Holliday junction resolvase [Arthrobacter phage Abba]QIN94371.1 RusA-like resolvase [Arthrobacter phage Abba]